MKKVKAQHKENLVQKQIVAGREFKGTAFIAKPDVILFKDFEVGKTYKQKVLITNVSFSFNSYKVLPITDAYKDFFEITWAPSGRMSAGLSNTVEVAFSPQINEVIVTALPLLAETGRIDIPLECYCRKAIVKPDKTSLDFGSVIYGEEGKVRLVLHNTGALSTNFEILTQEGKRLPLSKPIKLAPAQLAGNLLKQQESALEEARQQEEKDRYPEKKEEPVEEHKEEEKQEEEKKEEEKKEEKKSEVKKI
eukprot:TRINITY_DN7033_c0_g1_i5.p1 TRINITY_DN7033_c0_g1~~TRINITY_DN7033_c0_g1_i5.p1  ORF type:complete len:272 (-),score=72.21 TRINITY_DN7033_c0_g1_i5:805-1554(-)